MIWITGDDLTVPLRVCAVCGAPCSLLLLSGRWLSPLMALIVRPLPGESTLSTYETFYRIPLPARGPAALLSSGTPYYVSAPIAMFSILISIEAARMRSRSTHSE